MYDTAIDRRGAAVQDIPKFWDASVGPLWTGKEPETPLEKAVRACSIGEFGVCVDDCGCAGKFRYLIAGKYDGREVPEGLAVYTLPTLERAKFRCSGPMPESLQAMNTKIFREWLPGNTEFEIAWNANIEWYSMEKPTDAADYESEIRIPVKRK